MIATPASGSAAGRQRRAPRTAIALRCAGLVKRYGDVIAVDGLDLEVRTRRVLRPARPERRRQDHHHRDPRRACSPPDAGEVEVLGRRWGRDADHLRAAARHPAAGDAAQRQADRRARLAAAVPLVLRAGAARSTSCWRSVGLEAKRDARYVASSPAGRSSGWRVACALVGDPDLLFLDEPTTGLDPQSRRQLWDLLSQATAPAAAPSCSPRTTWTRREVLCDRVAIVDQGKVIALGTPRELIASLGAEHVVEFALAEGEPLPDARRADARCPASRRASVQDDRGTLIVSQLHEAMPALLASVGRSPDAFTLLTTHSATLEDVFVALTGRHLRDMTSMPRLASRLVELTLGPRCASSCASRRRCSGCSRSRCCWPSRSALAFRNQGARRTCSSACCAAAQRRTRDLVSDARSTSRACACGRRSRRGRRRAAQRRDPARSSCPGAPVTYELDPSRPESRVAGFVVDDVLQRSGPHARRCQSRDDSSTVPGSRYIDWLMPGLLGMNIMGTGMWSVGFSVVEARVAQAAQAADGHADARGATTCCRTCCRGWSSWCSRSAAAARLRRARLRRPRSRLDGCCSAALLLLGALAFSGLGLLVASRAQTIEGVSGLMNLVMVPMWVFSGRVLRLREFPGGDAAVHPAAAADGAERRAARRDDRRQRLADARAPGGDPGRLDARELHGGAAAVPLALIAAGR